MKYDDSINIRLPKTEKKILDNYCKRVKRNKTDVIREFIRSLAER
ncbi:MAG: ribbon-helix-helix protein, CopG family [Oculatellaceae cyanobacterium Prado106]|nr:ribbon-helix-helix protein, CopG family [Oculatellaceae cyanobacterium Prado106]